MTSLFAYGTLMEQRVFELITKETRTPMPATLHGFCRRAFTEACYPGVIPATNHEQVAGLIFSDISPSIWQRLDNYESDMYSRQAVSVRVESGGMAAADTYVVKAEFRTLLANHDWDFEYFLSRDLADYLKRHQTLNH